VPPTVACLHHLEQPFLGHAARVLRDAGLALDERDLTRGAALPDLATVDAIVTLGGNQSARGADSRPELSAEAALLRRAAEEGVPMLGICLGAQLLARALGAPVRRMARRQVAWVPVKRLPTADGDPLVGALPSPLMALHWNEDCFGLPEGGTELLSPAGEGCEAFRWGERAWGLQFHPEVDGPILDGWYRDGCAELAQAGVAERDARAADARHLPGQRAVADALFGAFAAELARAPARA
jgi:GMP synthase-like glutamine amidotransferase